MKLNIVLALKSPQRWGWTASTTAVFGVVNKSEWTPWTSCRKPSLKWGPGGESQFTASLWISLEIDNCFFLVKALCSSHGVRSIGRVSASLLRCVNIYCKLWKFQGALKNILSICFVTCIILGFPSWQWLRLRKKISFREMRYWKNNHLESICDTDNLCISLFKNKNKNKTVLHQCKYINASFKNSSNL